MRDKHIEYEQIENLLRKAHVPEASAELKERITARARNAWTQTSPEVSWRVPLRRLASAAAAAVVIVWVTNYSSDRALQKWKSGESFATQHWPTDLDALSEVPYGPFAKYLATVRRKPSAIGVWDLYQYVETVRRAIDESRQNGTLDSAAPSRGSSRLLPPGLSADSHSWT